MIEQLVPQNHQRLSYLYNTQELLLVALFAGLGLGTKSLVGPIVKSFTAALFIPGGAVAGGFYMLWLVLARWSIRKPFSGTFVAVVQSFSVFMVPFGSHGIFSIVTYTMPGISVDLLYYGVRRFVEKRSQSGADSPLLLVMCLSTGVANTVGTFLSAMTFRMFEGLPLIIIGVILGIAFFSGSIGGILAFRVFKEIEIYLRQELTIDDEPALDSKLTGEQ